jgi:hypothetical protein
MNPRLVVGLFRSSGIAEDARNRLKAEGVAGSGDRVEDIETDGAVTSDAGAGTRNPVGGSADLRQCSGNFCEVYPQWRNRGFRVAQPATRRQSSPLILCVNMTRLGSMSCLSPNWNSAIQFRIEFEFINSYSERGTRPLDRPLILQ